MIVVTGVFGLIAYFEWRYLRRHHRSRRTIRIILGFLSTLWILTSAIVLFQDVFSVGIMIAGLFEPLQRLIFTAW